LTSLYSLESSLDILRKYKPDYTPRTGFAWPITETMERAAAGVGSGGEANANNAGKKQTAADDHHDAPSTTTPSGGEPLPNADPDLIKKLEKERALTHPKKQQNTALLLNAMRTTAAHPFMTFHEREAAAAATATTATTAAASTAAATAAAAPSETVASEGQRSSVTPAPALMPSQSTGSQSTYGPSAIQDSAKGAVVTAKRKKKRASVVMPAPT